MGHRSPGIHQCVFQAIIKCDINIRSALFAQIVACGGAAECPNFGSRLAKELTALTPIETHIDIVMAPRHAAWIGGSLQASGLSGHANESSPVDWITAEDYHVMGVSAVHCKCF